MSHERQLPAESQEQELTHNCGEVGFYYNSGSHISEAVQALSLLQHRGQEGSAVCAIDEDGSGTFWETNDLLNVAVHSGGFRQFRNRVQGEVRIAIGHNRYSTSGSDRRDARQPFISNNLITAHNGNLTNPRQLPGFNPDRIISDTYALHHSFLSAEGDCMEEKITNVLPFVEGAYSLVLADPQKQILYGIRDPWGMRPLQLGQLKDKRGYVFASESQAIQDIVDEQEEIPPGYGIKIVNGQPEVFYRDPRTVNQASCSFEPPYFARPETDLFGLNAGEFRVKSGSRLADNDFQEGFRFDAISAVPKSGLKAMEGYVNRMNKYIPTEMVNGLNINEKLNGIFDDKEVNPADVRTFIQNGDREAHVRRKYKVDARAVYGKSLVLVDDSLVRGTTSRILTTMMREAGAREVHWRFATPRIEHACFWGIDFPTQDELIAVGMSDEEIAEVIGADSVRYMPLDDYKETLEVLSGHDRWCTHCFSGERPMEINKDYMIFKSDINVR